MDELRAAEEWWDRQADKRKVSLWKWMTQPKTEDLQHPNQLSILHELPTGGT